MLSRVLIVPCGIEMTKEIADNGGGVGLNRTMWN